MQIALWSNQREGSGVSTLSGVLATVIAAQNGYKTLITHTMTKDLSLENYLLKPNERELKGYIGESNMDGILRLIKNGKLTADQVKDYCFSLLSHSNLDFIHSRKVYEPIDHYENAYNYLLHLARQFYDVTVVDLCEDIESPLFFHVLKETDVLIIVGNQNRYHLELLSETLAKYEEKLSKYRFQSVLVVNKYDFRSNVPLNKLMVPFRIKKPIVIPYQVELTDCSNRSELVDYILRHMHNTKKNEFSAFIQSVMGLSKEVLNLYQEVNEHAL